MIKPHGHFSIKFAIFIAFNVPVYCAIRLVSIVLPQDEANDHIYANEFLHRSNKIDNYIFLSQRKSEGNIFTLSLLLF